jgi:hypothetical protein
VENSIHGRFLAGEEPPQPLRGEIHAIADPVLLRSFKELCDRADAIVEGVVETDASRMMPGPGSTSKQTSGPR